MNPSRFSNSSFIYVQRMVRPVSLLVSASVMLGALGACGKNVPNAEAPGGPGKMSMPVTVIETRIQRVPIVVEAVGQAEGSKEVEVRARAAGVLTRQLYNEGDSVKAGATLFTIDRVPYENALAQARAALAQDRASEEKAQREAARLKPLAEQKAISQKEYDDASTALKTAEAAVMASTARVRDAELNLSYTTVTAPISGVTGRAQRSEGSLVVPGNESGFLTTISVNDPIWVRFSFSEGEALKLRQAGAKAVVKLVLSDGSAYGVSGKLNFAASTVDRKTGTVALRAAFPNPRLMLLPGQFVSVQVTTGERDGYLVPQSAVSQSDRGKVLFTVSPDNKVVPQPVETAGWLGHDWVVTKGIAPGDRVIIDNLMKLRPGAPVAPHAPGQAPGGAGSGGNSGPEKSGSAAPEARKADEKPGSGKTAK
jgi:membrane fusion protein, multidrug efflux system